MLVATVLTTALITGAARGTQAAPANKPQAVSVARRLAAKLTTSLRHVVPAARLIPCAPATTRATSLPSFLRVDASAADAVR